MIGLYDWFKGVLMGFFVSAPIGPVGILCIQRALSKNFLHGFFSGLGAAIGDSFYAAIAAFGLTFVIDFLLREDFWFKLIGGFFLIILGLFWVYQKKQTPVFHPPLNEDTHLGRSLTTAFLLSLANPMTLIIYLALFSGFGLAHASQNFFSASFLILGVFMGAVLWWLLIIEIMVLSKKKLTEKAFPILNKVTASLVIIFGLFILLTAFFHINIFGKTF